MMAKLADAQDLKSCDRERSCGFDSRSSHYTNSEIISEIRVWIPASPTTSSLNIVWKKHPKVVISIIYKYTSQSLKVETITEEAGSNPDRATTPG